MWTAKSAKILFIVLATLGIAVAHFMTSTGSHGLHVVHILLAGASILVIGVAGLWYGWRGGFSTAVATTAIYLAHVVLDWPNQPMENANQIAFAAIYLFVGAITGILSDLEARETTRRIEAERASQRNAIILSLSALDQALGLRDGGTLRHSENVAQLAVEISRHMGLAEERIEDLRFAALVHDIGKIGVRDDILLNPGKLTPQEMAAMRLHPETAAAILASIPGAAHIADIVLSHHERIDGNGYPRGIGGGQIPQEARILSVADVYCALTEERPYNAGTRLTPAQAVLFCEGQCGLALDPAPVLVLRQLIGGTKVPETAKTEQLGEFREACGFA